MEKGIFYDQNILDTLYQELWLPIPPSLIPNIKPYYYISNKGRVWSINGGLMTPHLNQKGYPHVQARTYDDKPKDITIHRIEMLLFNK